MKKIGSQFKKCIGCGTKIGNATKGYYCKDCKTKKEKGECQMTMREKWIDFILRTYKENFTQSQLEQMSDEELKKLHDEAYRYTEWGL